LTATPSANFAGASFGPTALFRREESEMPSQVTYGQLRTVLSAVGFREIRKPEGVALRHAKSDTLFLFRPYQESDRMQFAKIWHVRFMLDQRGLLEPESFEALLAKAPA
jgi:hypothetical protein